MNRQIVAFLSLFSLVLVLSIYYVMQPFAPNDSKDKNVNVDIEDSSQLYFAALEDKKGEVYVTFIDDQTSIIASSTATNQEKSQALVAIENKRAIHDKESNTKTLLVNAGFDAAYVELVDDGTIQVVITKEQVTKTDIAKSMMIVFNEFGNQYTPRISVYKP